VYAQIMPAVGVPETTFWRPEPIVDENI